MSDIDISIAICTWNRAHLLVRTLDSLVKMRKPPQTEWQLFVINNNCSDSTDETIASYRDRIPIVRLFEPLAGLSHARNRALAEAKGTHILFTDDDVIVGIDWLCAFWESAVKHPGAAAFGGPIYPLFEQAPDPALVQAFPLVANGFCGIDHKLEEGIISNDLPIYGANMGFSRTAIAGLSFDPSMGDDQGPDLLGGDDVQFVNSIKNRGGSIVWSPKMSVKHLVEPSRLKIDYLKKITIGRARGGFRCGLQKFSGKPIFGAPRWLWRDLLTAYILHVRYKFTGDRINSLKLLRKHWITRAYIQECRAVSRKLK